MADPRYSVKGDGPKLRRDGCGFVYYTDPQTGQERFIGIAQTLLRHPIHGKEKVLGYVVEKDGEEIGVRTRLRDAYNVLMFLAGIGEAAAGILDGKEEGA